MIRFWVLSVFLILSKSVFSQERQVEDGSTKEIFKPGIASSVSFFVENNDTFSKTYSLIAKTSDNLIRPILNRGEIVLDAKEKRIVIVPLIIDAKTSSGTKTISLFINDTALGGQTIKTASVTISAIQNISLTTLQVSDLVKAGEKIQSSILLKNIGNGNEIIALSSRNAVIDQGASIVMAPGEERVITVSHQTDAKMGRLKTINLDLTAHVVGAKEQKYFSNQLVTIIPEAPLQEDIFQRFPVSASVSFLGMRNNGSVRHGFQGELYGRGNLNDKYRSELEFRAVSANPITFNTFTQYEEYFMKYIGEKFYVHLGDKIYSSSFLTEYARYGRGAEVRFDIGKVNLGGFYNRPRFFYNIKEEFNLYTTFNLNSSTNFTAGYLHKTPLEGLQSSDMSSYHIRNNAHLPYVVAQTRLLDKINLIGEWAYSRTADDQGNAFRIQADGNFNKITASMIYLKATPLFAGYYTNTSMINSNAKYSISKKIDFFANFNQDAKNFQRDTLLFAAPYRSNIHYGLNYRYNNNGNMMLFNGYQKYDDRLMPKQFNYEELFLRISVNQKISDFFINLESQFGKTENHITGFSGNSNYYTANLSYDKYNTTFNLFGSVAKTSRYREKNQRQFFYGAKVMSRLSEKSILNLSYQNDFMPEEYFRDRNQFEILFKQKIKQAHSIDLSGRYMLQRGALGHKDFIVSLRYTLQLNVPIRKIASYSSLSGNIRNLGVEKTEGIKLNLGNHMAIADKEGKFLFKNVVPGDYFLEIDRASTSMDDISDVSLPVQLKIEEKAENIFNFGMTRAAKIVGQVLLLGANDHSDQYNWSGTTILKSKTSNHVIVEANNGKQIFRKICEIGADFDFTYLVPDTWKIKIYGNNLDKRFRIVKDTFEFVLRKGEVKKIAIEIIKKEIEIKHQKEVIKIGYKGAVK